MKRSSVTVLGAFCADATYRGSRQPRMGETVLMTSFALGPGGKGSNQAVACGRLGAPTRFISRLGDDAFADLAERTWRDAGVEAHAPRDGASYTGSAGIFVDDTSGDNAIGVAPGAANELTVEHVEAARMAIESASVFVSQLETPLEATQRAFEIARAAGVITILNPAPAAELPDALVALCDWLTPNESEAETLTGVPVHDDGGAERAARALMERGAGGAVITLGERGALVCTADGATHVPAQASGPVVETTGAGDAFNGGFAVALSEGQSPVEAARFGCAVAGMSVTRFGAAASMPTRDEIRSA